VFPFWVHVRDFSLSTASSSGNIEDVSLGVKRPGHETDHSPLSMPRLRIVELYLHFFTHFLGMTFNYIKDRGNFTLYSPSDDIRISKKVKLSL
jgi:hypothetical protein